MAVATDAVSVRWKGEFADSAPAAVEDARWEYCQYFIMASTFRAS